MVLREQLEQKTPLMGYTPLHVALDKSNALMVDILLAKGTEVNAKATGLTPMGLAASRLLGTIYFNTWKIIDAQYIGLSKEKGNLWSDTLVQCAREDGWIKWQERMREVMRMLAQYGGVESRPEDVFAALEQPLDYVVGFFESAGIDKIIRSGEDLE